jgi:hypothetical protein
MGSPTDDSALADYKRQYPDNRRLVRNVAYIFALSNNETDCSGFGVDHLTNTKKHS